MKYSIKLILPLLFVGLIISCRKANNNNNEIGSYKKEISYTCVEDIDSLQIELEKKINKKYGSIFIENYSGISLIHSDSNSFYFRGVRKVWKNPNLDSIPQAIFNYKTCRLENINFIKVRPYQKS